MRIVRTAGRMLAGLAAGGCLTVALAAQQNPPQTPPPQTPPQQTPPQTPPPPKSADVTVTGCLLLGASPDAYLLSNATAKGSTTESPRTYRVVAGDDRLDLKAHLNSRVEIVGAMREGAAPGTPEENQDQQSTIVAKQVTHLSGTCATR